MTRDTEKAFKWIVGLLNSHNILFQISGGFAARLYGSTRELNDIDLDLSQEGIERVKAEVNPYIVYGPEHFIDGRWDCFLLTLNYEGQEIDLCATDDLRIFDAEKGIWLEQNVDLNKSHHLEAFGAEVSVIEPAALIKYKKLLEGEHQKIDIQAVEMWLKEHRKV